MFGFGFSASKLKPQLKMAVSRLQIAANKKTALLKQQMREVAVLLAEEPPREEKAKIRAESLIREDNTVEAYEILQLECELLAERIKLLESCKECPPDLVSVVSTLIWAEGRVDIPELTMIRKQLRWKYGKEFEEAALNNVGGVLNSRVVSKLSVQPPAAYLVQVYLEKICEQHEVDWKPTVRLSADEMAEPMAAPVGYSVEVAGASGLGTNVTTGQPNCDEEIGVSKGNGGDSDLQIPAAPVVAATPYIPNVTTPSTKPQSDFQEVDIFVPAIPKAPTGDDNKTNGDDTDKGDLPPAAPSGTGGTSDEGMSSSYADLAARFDKLKK